jgi:hypothetical protein
MPLQPKEVLATEDRLARPSSWVTSFSLSHDSLRVGREILAKWLHSYISLLGPYTSMRLVR